jgi:predicted RNA-binding protein with PIN domain
MKIRRRQARWRGGFFSRLPERPCAYIIMAPLMTTRWTIIDGNNLIHADPDLSEARQQDFQTARQVLVRRLEAICENTGGRVTVVFDSRTPKTFTGFEGSPLDVRFADPGVGADAFIERLVHASADPARITVITSDATERRVVEAAGAMSQSCRLFLRQATLDQPVFQGRLRAAGGPSLTPRLADVWKRRETP